MFESTMTELIVIITLCMIAYMITMWLLFNGLNMLNKIQHWFYQRGMK